ncbi:hypothetical protein [Pseudonocardia endophytica]|uniref:hypothetical protein n=1 Tax=Pseudonocardia endophytica TaxID=401976 RepID=UPI00104EF8FA|nr:hypothetical protein [Pseudonocardia endophytica]
MTDRIRLAVDYRPLDEALAHRMARALIWEPLTGMTIEQEYDGLLEALASDHRLSTWTGDPRAEGTPIPEARFRDYLRAIVRNLDAMRPWPRPLIRVLPVEIYERSYASSRTIARLLVDVLDVQSRIHRALLPVDLADGSQYCASVVELRSGREIAFVGDWFPDDGNDFVAVQTRDPDVPAAEIVAELTSDSTFDPEECQILR